ncbi:O5AR1 protein, partial [Myiagra hebetior]|nr:O5AR1 protein [Myiagra hebetior]
NEMFASEFILLGFTTRAELRVVFFVLFLAIYVVTLLGNLGVIVLIRMDPRLHTPMYFFLSHLSLLDICYSSTIIPRSLRDFLAEKKEISFARCVTQCWVLLFSFATWASTECYVLAAMAYGRYVAICRPLLYSVLTSQRICLGMLAGVHLAGVLSSILHTVSIFHAPFCRSQATDHFFCDGALSLALSCSDTRASEAVVAIMVGFNVLSTMAFILVSYSSILRHKALSTCASHLASIALYYGSTILTYLRPVSSRSSEQDEVLSLLCSIAVPVLNPFVYSLRD